MARQQRAPVGSPAGHPAIVGPCRLVEPQGAGSDATVYLAELVEPRPYGAVGDRVAIKIVHAKPGHVREAVAGLRREALVSGRAGGAGLPRVHEVGRHAVGRQTLHYLIREHVSGRSLRRMLEDDGPLPEPLIRHVAAAVARSLEALHACGVVHGDVKPENVIVTPDHRVSLIDLGLARGGEEAAGDAGTFSGTLDHASPEQLLGDDVGPSSDLHALGVLMHELATGENPFAVGGAGSVATRIAHQAPGRVLRVRRDVSDFFDAFVARLLAKDPGARFASAGDAASTLEAGEGSPWWIARRLAETSPRSGHVVPLPVARRTKLAGREEEMAILDSLLQEVRSGRGRCVILEGEAGAGKTRLACDFVERAAAAGELVALAGEASAAADSGLDPLCQAIVSHLGGQPDASRIGELLVDAPGLAAPLADHLMDRQSGRAMAPGSDTIVAALTAAATELARTASVAWIVEDLHAVPPQVAARLVQFARSVRSQRVLLVVTTRPGADAGVLRQLLQLEGSRLIAVSRLDEQAVREIAAEALGSREVAATVAHVVARVSSGSPLFVLNLLDDLEPSGIVRREASGRLVLESDPERVRVPTSMGEYLGQRLQRLDDAERQLVSIAAIVGLIVDPDLLAGVLEQPRLAVLQALGRLVQQASIFRADGRSYRFDHHALREVALEAVDPARRREIHGLVAMRYQQGLEGRTPSPADEQFLAEHFVGAGRVREAAPFLPGVLRRLNWRFSHGAALALADAALAETVGVPPGVRARLYFETAHALGGLGRDLERRGACLDEALVLAEEVGAAQLARYVRRQATRVAIDSARFDEARALLDRLESSADPTDVEDELVLLASRAACEILAGRHALAREPMERSHAIAARIGDKIAEGRSACNVAVVALNLGDFDDAELWLRRNLACLDVAPDPRGEVRCHGNLAMLAVRRGDLGGMQRHLEAALAAAATIGDQISVFDGTYLRWEHALLEGRLDDAEAALQSCAAIAATTVARQRSTTRQAAAEIALQRGDCETARDLLRALADEARAAGEERRAILVEALLAESLERLGDRNGAIALLEKVERSSDDLGVGMSALASAHLARLGLRDPATIEPHPKAAASLRLQTLSALARAGGPDERVTEGIALAERMSAHLRGSELEAFWQNNREARWLAEVATRRGIAAAGDRAEATPA